MVKNLGLSFEDLGIEGGLSVTSYNRAEYVQRKIQRVLVDSRREALDAIKDEINASLWRLSSDAPDLMNLLAAPDWRVLLCGEAHISSAQVVSKLSWFGFPPASMIPKWLPDLLNSFDEDALRRFLVFVCGSPSLPLDLETVVVRCQPRSPALPVAHTCFFHLDVPDYASEAMLRKKFVQAISESGTFDIV
eukprot:CAMPEP_0171455590 /NCGR_PEP_ID=MMETSP0945-20130129/2423_1 /TAXON_ID=109269 /ORGANISM="Vaucheria litorea, Strain CCMP2940" /LENGTH=190 /DNA_ID=CAMNT_0011980859 /DNA_START=477 /DNA_END=1049 /DNA_ORIENTATION=-